jgi:hypothetical protein
MQERQICKEGRKLS